MKFNLHRFCTAKVYKKGNNANPSFAFRGFFWINRSNYRYDEYYAVGSIYYLPFQGIQQAGYSGPYPFREIPGKVVTHDIGNGENDFQLSKIILDAQYDTKNYGLYNYSSLNPDPVLQIEPRNTTYQGELPTSYVDLIALNQAAVPGINPWRSRDNTPGGTTISANDIDATRESLVLVCPFTKYRRCRIYIQTKHKMTTIRGMQLSQVEFTRKTYA